MCFNWKYQISLFIYCLKLFKLNQDDENKDENILPLIENEDDLEEGVKMVRKL